MDLQKGDEVYIKATVADVPMKGCNIYRIVTNGGNNDKVIWCTRDELIKVGDGNAGKEKEEENRNK